MCPMKWDPFLSRLEWDYIQFLLTIPIVRTIPKPQSLLRSEGFGSTLLLRFRKGLCYTCSCDKYHPHWDLSIPPGGYFFLLKLLRFSKNIGVLQKLGTHIFAVYKIQLFFPWICQVDDFRSHWIAHETWGIRWAMFLIFSLAPNQKTCKIQTPFCGISILDPNSAPQDEWMWWMEWDTFCHTKLLIKPYYIHLYPHVICWVIVAKSVPFESLWISGFLMGQVPFTLNLIKMMKGIRRETFFFYYIYQSFSRNFFPTNVPHEF